MTDPNYLDQELVIEDELTNLKIFQNLQDFFNFTDKPELHTVGFF